MRKEEWRMSEPSRYLATDQWCDLCGAKAPRFGFNTEIVNNGTERYKYGDDSGPVSEFDLCPECFEKKLKPWIESQKVTVE